MSIQTKYDEVTRVLGHVIIGFNELEIATGGAIMRLLKQDDRVGSVFVALLSFKTKIDLLKALAFKIEGNELCSRFKELLQQAEKINAERNRFIHADYNTVGEDDEAVGMVASRLRDLHKYDFHDGIETNFKYIQFVNSEELMDLANDASILADQLLRFSEQFNPGCA
jgi:hypothetical protein